MAVGHSGRGIGFTERYSLLQIGGLCNKRHVIWINSCRNMNSIYCQTL
jgi:hypothetical protein